MNYSDVPNVLNQLLRTQARSLPQYLNDARPWTGLDGKPVTAALASLAADQRSYAEQVAEAVLELGGRPDPGGFPIEFTAIHDVALDYVLCRVIEQQRGHVDMIAQCARQLEPYPRLHALAQEVLGNARGHLAMLEELAVGGRR